MKFVSSNRPAVFRALYYVGPLLLWMAFIYSMSTDRASTTNTTPVVHSLLDRLFPWLSDLLTAETRDRVDFNIRKAAHVTEYAIFAILAFRAVAFGNPHYRNRNTVVPILLGILYAASDEYHQSFYASRDGAAADVFYDTFGVITGQLLCQWQHLAREARDKSRVPAKE